MSYINTKYNMADFCGQAVSTDYYTRAGLTLNDDETEMVAVCNYVHGLDINGLLPKAKCIYLVSPKSLAAASHQLLSSSFQMSYFGNTAGVHATTGITGNPSQNFAVLTGFVPNLNGLSQTNFCTHARVRSSFQDSGYNYGASTGKGVQAHLVARTIADKVRFGYYVGAGAEFDNFDAAGSYTYSEDTAGATKSCYKDGVLLGTTTPTFPLLGVEVALWATTQFPVGYSSHEQNYFGWFEVLTSAEVAIHNTLEATYQSEVIAGGR